VVLICSFQTMYSSLLAVIVVFASSIVIIEAHFDEEVDKRSYLSPSCQRCLQDPEDWLSCQNCYGRPGVVPYYGFNKRSGDVEKRSNFLTCRCCISLAARKCCEKCSLTPYYGKRSYEPQLYGWNDVLQGDCSCCTTEPYNFGCCNSSCSRRM
jgi:hypothetical protein